MWFGLGKGHRQGQKETRTGNGAGILNYNSLGGLALFELQGFPIGLGDELGQVATIVGLGAQPVAGLPVLGLEGHLNNLALINLDLLTNFYIIEFNCHRDCSLLSTHD